MSIALLVIPILVAPIVAPIVAFNVARLSEEQPPPSPKVFTSIGPTPQHWWEAKTGHRSISKPIRRREGNLQLFINILSYSMVNVKLEKVHKETGAREHESFHKNSSFTTYLPDSSYRFNTTLIMEVDLDWNYLFQLSERTPNWVEEIGNKTLNGWRGLLIETCDYGQKCNKSGPLGCDGFERHFMLEDEELEEMLAGDVRFNSFPVPSQNDYETSRFTFDDNDKDIIKLWAPPNQTFGKITSSNAMEINNLINTYSYLILPGKQANLTGVDEESERFHEFRHDELGESCGAFFILSNEPGQPKRIQIVCFNETQQPVFNPPGLISGFVHDAEEFIFFMGSHQQANILTFHLCYIDYLFSNNARITLRCENNVAELQNFTQSKSKHGHNADCTDVVALFSNITKMGEIQCYAELLSSHGVYVNKSVSVKVEPPPVITIYGVPETGGVYLIKSKWNESVNTSLAKVTVEGNSVTVYLICDQNLVALHSYENGEYAIILISNEGDFVIPLTCELIANGTESGVTSKQLKIVQDVPPKKLDWIPTSVIIFVVSAFIIGIVVLIVFINTEKCKSLHNKGNYTAAQAKDLPNNPTKETEI